jgi:hypothetical protein
MGPKKAHHQERLDFHGRSAFFNFAQFIKLSSPAPRTVFTCTLPILGSSQIAVPKRPSSTLARTGVINLAFSSLIVEENAVSVTELFEASADADFSCVLVFEFFDGQFDQFRNPRNLFLVNPDVARRSGATITASGTFELQTVLIPGLLGNFLGHCFLWVVRRWVGYRWQVGFTKSANNSFSQSPRSCAADRYDVAQARFTARDSSQFPSKRKLLTRLSLE